MLLHLEARFKRLFAQAVKDGSPRVDVVPDAGGGHVARRARVGAAACRGRNWFAADGRLTGASVEDALAALEKLSAARLAGIAALAGNCPWLEERRRRAERKELRREYELKVHSGEWPEHETRVPLFPYQREGMLHLAFTERALLADEMGLGKTIQAIAACALLKRLGRAGRVLVVTPASLKGRVGGANPAVHRSAATRLGLWRRRLGGAARSLG